MRHKQIFPGGSEAMYLSAFGSPVHLHTQVVPVLLPVQFAIDYVEQIPHTNFLSRRQLHQSHSCWDVFVLRHPESNYVTTWRP